MKERGRKVLLIDDSTLSLLLEKEALTRAGFEVRTAASISEFETHLASWSPDIVLTDVNMPDMSGVDLCRHLKARLETARTPVVLFSSLSDAALERLAEDCGADGYLSKANGLERLPQEVQALWESILW